MGKVYALRIAKVVELVYQKEKRYLYPSFGTLKLPAVELQGTFNLEYRHPRSKTETTFAKRFQLLCFTFRLLKRFRVAANSKLLNSERSPLIHSSLRQSNSLSRISVITNSHISFILRWPSI